mmetsp:Transcript_6422/g.9845  ORF Transcript_6422/g.9845 Transcript_6422/m.9845 type:complete len:82 (+) Transcript_6422:1052-1297(+)
MNEAILIDCPSSRPIERILGDSLSPPRVNTRIVALDWSVGARRLRFRREIELLGAHSEEICKLLELKVGFYVDLDNRTLFQ